MGLEKTHMSPVQQISRVTRQAPSHLVSSIRGPFPQSLILGPVFSQPAKIRNLQSKTMWTHSQNAIAQLTELHVILGQGTEWEHNFMKMSMIFLARLFVDDAGETYVKNALYDSNVIPGDHFSVTCTLIWVLISVCQVQSTIPRQWSRFTSRSFWWKTRLSGCFSYL